MCWWLTRQSAGLERPGLGDPANTALAEPSLPGEVRATAPASPRLFGSAGKNLSARQNPYSHALPVYAGVNLLIPLLMFA
jgi:hypothetical protein